MKDHFLPGGDIGGLVNVSGAGILRRPRQGAAQRLHRVPALPRRTDVLRLEKSFEYPLAGTSSPTRGSRSSTRLIHHDVDLSDLGDLEGTLDLLGEVGLL